MSTYNPFVAAATALTCPDAIAFYQDAAEDAWERHVAVTHFLFMAGYAIAEFIYECVEDAQTKALPEADPVIALLPPAKDRRRHNRTTTVKRVAPVIARASYDTLAPRFYPVINPIPVSQVGGRRKAKGFATA